MVVALAMRFACIQHDIAWEDKPANHALVEHLIDSSRVPAGAFILLPEMGDTGFSFNLDRITDERTVPWASAAAAKRGVLIQAGHARRGPDGRGRNVTTIVDHHGAVIGAYEKIHPFSFGREIEYFTGGDRLLLANVGNTIVCPLICYDLRFPEAWRLATRAGAEVFTIGASWPKQRQHHWRALVIARAIENQAFVVAVNRVGRDPHLEYAGGSLIVSPRGDILAEAGDGPMVLQADLDLADLRAWRNAFPALSDMKSAFLGDIEIAVAQASERPPECASTRNLPRAGQAAST